MIRHRHTASNGDAARNVEEQEETMELPLFPLKNVVLFPGMALPLHIFEMRYREMINRCIDEGLPFGVVLIQEGNEVGATAKPHMVGTTARIGQVQRLDDGRMNITALGVQRFRILEFDHSHSYLSATVRHFPVVNGGTKQAMELAQIVRPRIVEYVDLLGQASGQQLQIDVLPEDPTALAFLVAIALQVNPAVKQKLLECVGVPEMLISEANLLLRENMFTRFMAETQGDILRLNSGPTGYVFPN